jgi:hypothetical protein
MSLVRFTACLVFVVIFAAVSSAAAQTAAAAPQPPLEIAGENAGYFWIVETAANGSRRGGWVSKQTPLDRIDRSILRPIPPLPMQQTTQAPPPLPVSSPSPETGNIDDRLARIEQALANLTMPAASAKTGAYVPPAPVREVEQQPRPQQPIILRPLQTREGFWFNGGMGVGSAGCVGCTGRETGLSGGLSFGGTVSERLLFGVGTTGWHKSVNGLTVSGGTFDGRIRFYPVVTSGFFLTAGAGLGSISASDAFDSVREHGFGALFGIGWDVRLNRNVSLTPFYNGFAVGVTSGTFYVDQFGIGITVH